MKIWGHRIAIVPVVGMTIGLGSPLGGLLGNSVAWADGTGQGQAEPFSAPPIVAPIVAPLGASVLSGWQAPEGIGDYREHIRKTPFGYLRWQRFPVRVAIEPVLESPGSAAAERDQRWVAAVRGAIADWQPYFPLVEVTAESRSGQGQNLEGTNLEQKDLHDRGEWDIYVARSRPPLQRLPDGTILPARFADARYEILSPPSGGDPVKFRFRIRLGNQQGEAGLRATARHELGHALGLWGHSTHPEDVMYPTQMGNYPPISDRDLKTLQWLYSAP
jgi:predicted Zn-dependent protease